MGLFGEVSLNNALIDMYVKCGMGAEAFALFDQMHASGVKPDSIVGLGVLSACCRAGLVLKGLEIYNSLVKDHGVHPSEEMSACIVNLLGRSGMIDHAFDFIKSMSVEPGPSVWGALLDASVIHSNKEIQDLAHSSLLRLEEGNPPNLVLVSNLHASSGRWNIVEQVRAKIQQGSLKKTPGRSWESGTFELICHLHSLPIEKFGLEYTAQWQISATI